MQYYEQTKKISEIVQFQKKNKHKVIRATRLHEELFISIPYDEWIKQFDLDERKCLRVRIKDGSRLYNEYILSSEYARKITKQNRRLLK